MTRRLQWPPGRGGEEQLQVMFCASPGYFQHVAVAAVSLADNNRQSAVDVYLLTCDRDAVAENMLRTSVSRYENLTLTIYLVPADRLGRLFVDRYLTKETYLRIFAPEVLPSGIDRVIYLDSDLVVLDDLQPLWNTDLGQKTLAAAPDLFGQERREALGMPRDRVYVNAGVLVLDLQRWRRENLTQQLIEYIERRGAALALHDQDAINAVLQDAIRVVDRRWNVQAPMFRAVRKCFPMEFRAIREACRRPAIIHFSGPEKPWLFRSRVVRKRDYFRYLDKTAWRGARPALTTITQRFEYQADRLLSRARIDYLQVSYKVSRVSVKLRILVAALTHRTPGTMTPIVEKAGSVEGDIR